MKSPNSNSVRKSFPAYRWAPISHGLTWFILNVSTQREMENERNMGEEGSRERGKGEKEAGRGEREEERGEKGIAVIFSVGQSSSISGPCAQYSIYC